MTEKFQLKEDGLYFSAVLDDGVATIPEWMDQAADKFFKDHPEIELGIVGGDFQHIYYRFKVPLRDEEFEALEEDNAEL